MNNVVSDMNRSMSMYWYEQWYLQSVKPYLKMKEKRKLLDRIMEQALKEPIFEPGFFYPKESFPELAPYTKDKDEGKELTGIQLYAVAMLIGQEIGMPCKRGSEMAFGTPILPDLPR